MKYAKAAVGAVTAGSTALGFALADGSLTANETLGVVLAVLGALGFVAAVPNKDKGNVA
jgi:hypothetical protein